MIKLGDKVKIVDTSEIRTVIGEWFLNKIKKIEEKHPEVAKWYAYNFVRTGREGILIKKINHRGHIYCLVSCEIDCRNRTIITTVKGLEKINRFSPKKKLKQKKKIKKPDTDVLISKEIYNQICKLRVKFWNNHRNNEAYPYCYMLGKDKKNIIRKITRLKRGAGDNCHRMVAISTSTMSEGMVTLIKEKLIPCGILRIGKFDGEPEYDRGPSLRQLCRGFKEAYIISLGNNNVIIVEQSYKRGEVKNLSYGIVK